jgi:hypothetical protein
MEVVTVELIKPFKPEVRFSRIRLLCDSVVENIFESRIVVGLW